MKQAALFFNSFLVKDPETGYLIRRTFQFT